MSDKLKTPRMQFGLSGLMMVVLAVAIACMGWKLDQWLMDNEYGQREFVACVLFAAMALTVLSAVIIGRWRASVYCMIGLLINACIVFGFLDPPLFVRDAMDAIIMLIFNLPIAAVAATTANVLAKPTWPRVALALSASFSAGWLLHAVYRLS